jgi:Uncharacterized protein conserved in bacteria (DUF2188)
LSDSGSSEDDMADVLPDVHSELLISPSGKLWRIHRAGTGQVLGEFEGRAEAIQEARLIAQREPGTSVKFERANGTMEEVPLLGRDPATEKG